MHEPAPHVTGASIAGSMTRVMRAAPTSAGRTLRVGVVRGGRMIDERLIKRGSRVIVGPGERADVVVPATDLPQEHVLFELASGVWRLGAAAWMRGRVAVHGEVVELDDATGRIELDASARGKVVIGSTTILFQLVTAPPVQPRPRLPLAVTRRAADIDLPTTIIAALSFLVHFLFVGALYSDWVDPVVDDNLQNVGLVEDLRALPPPPLAETAPEDPAETSAPAATATPARSSRAARVQTRGASSAAKATAAAALDRKLSALEMAVVGALGTSRAATGDVLKDDHVETSSLDAAAKRGGGVGGPATLGVGERDTRLRPGEHGGSLADLGSAEGATNTSSGRVQRTRAPRGLVAATPNVTSGVVPDAARVVAGLQGGFHACYQRALSDNPDAQGHAQLLITVGAAGGVQNATVSLSGNLPASMKSCIRTRALDAAFGAPQGGGTAVVVVPISFVQHR